MAYTLKESRLTYYVCSGSSSPYFDGDYYDDIRFRCKTYYEYDSVNLGYNIMCVYEAVWYQDIYIGRTASVTAEAKINGSSIGSYTKTVTSTKYDSAQTLSMTTKYGFVALESDGTCSFSLNFVGSTTKFGGTLSKSFTITYNLPTVSLYANITGFNIWNNGLNQIGASWSVDRNIDYLQYSLSGGGWTDASGTTFYVGGLNPGTQYSLRIRVKSTASQLWTESSTLYATTTDKNRMTSSIVNVTCDDSLQVTASNPSGEQCDIYIELLNANKTARIGEPIRHTNTLDTTFTVEEIQSLANYLPNSANANFRINVITVVDGIDKYLDYKDGTYTIINANPVFTNFTYEDRNATTIALTGSNQKIIKGYSNLRAIVSTANKAVAQKGATMVTYRLVVGTQQVDVPYSGIADVNLDLNAITSNVFIVYAIDSRGNSTPIQKSPAAYIEYTALARSSDSAVRTDNIDDETTLNFAGTMWSGSFGSQSNSLVASYRYRATDSPTWVNGATGISPTLGSGTFTYSGTIAGDLGASGFTVSDSFYIETTITDKLSSLVITSMLSTGKPNLAISKNGVAINSAYDEAIGGDLQVGGKLLLDVFYPVGTIYETTSTNFDTTAKMGTHFGGTWEVYGDGRVLVAKSADTEFDTIGKTGGAKTHTLTVEQLPSHNHSLVPYGYYNLVSTAYSGDSGWLVTEDSIIGDGGALLSVSSGNAGSGEAHNNLQPYIVVYRYRRTA